MKQLSILLVVLGLAAGPIFVASCGGDGGNKENDCSYDSVNALCQQAFDCCTEYVTWALEQGQQGYDQTFCVPYTCAYTPDSTCQGWIDQALQAEDTYQVDFPDCY